MKKTFFLHATVDLYTVVQAETHEEALELAAKRPLCEGKSDQSWVTEQQFLAEEPEALN